jgi:translation initiation factor IF-2
MSDTKSGDDKTLSVSTKKTLTLKRPGIDQGTVRQNFPHGRTKAVVVETKKRKFARPDEKPEVPQQPVVLKPRVQPAPPPAPRAEPPRPTPADKAGMVLNDLSNDEMEARRRALQGSKLREVEERKRASEDAQRRAEEEVRRAREREESARRQAEEDARIKSEAEARQRAEEEARRRAPVVPDVPVPIVDDERPRSGQAVKRGTPLRGPSSRRARKTAAAAS